jgi:hypothetical protein
MVLKAHQGRGIATEATALVVEKAKTDGRRRYLHAFPPPANCASNAIGRKLGFTLLGEVEFEFPPGNFAASNDWRLDLAAEVNLLHLLIGHSRSALERWRRHESRRPGCAWIVGEGCSGASLSRKFQ